MHNGRVAKRTRDWALAEFRSVVDAVRYAIEVQNGLIERNAGGAPRRQSLPAPILEIKPLRNRLRANKARQGELVQSNIGEAGNVTTAAKTRPAQGQMPYAPCGLRGQGQIEAFVNSTYDRKRVCGQLAIVHIDKSFRQFRAPVTKPRDTVGHAG